jgi:hypothetical protein
VHHDVSILDWSLEDFFQAGNEHSAKERDVTVSAFPEAVGELRFVENGVCFNSKIMSGMSEG